MRVFTKRTSEDWWRSKKFFPKSGFMFQDHHCPLKGAE
jgi:hypothetical protein